MEIINSLDFAQKAILTKYLEEFVTSHKLDLFEKKVKWRTRYLTVVLEDIFQSHNASAAMRSCECFGVQDIHVIEKKYNFSVTKEIAMGSSKWLTIHKYEGVKRDLDIPYLKLKEQGYRLVAMMPDEKCIDIQDLNLENGKIALLFGTELRGLSAKAISHADEFVKIPMVGFTESLNISVSVATSLFYLTDKLRRSKINWQLDASEIPDVRLSWLINAINHSDEIIELYCKRNPDFL